MKSEWLPPVPRSLPPQLPCVLSVLQKQGGEGWLVMGKGKQRRGIPGKRAGFLVGGSRELQDGFGATLLKDFNLERACLGFFMTFGELGAQHSIRDVV